MYSYGPPHMARQKQDDQLEHTYSSYVRIQDVALKTCQRQWTMGRSGERGSGISVSVAQNDDDIIAKYMYIFLNKDWPQQNITQQKLTSINSTNHISYTIFFISGRQTFDRTNGYSLGRESLKTLALETKKEKKKRNERQTEREESAC